MNATFREYMTLNDTPNYFDYLNSRDYLDVAKEAKKNDNYDEMWKALDKSVYHAVKFDNNPSFAVKDVNFLSDHSGYYNNGNVLASKYIISVIKSDFSEFSNDNRYGNLINILIK